MPATTLPNHVVVVLLGGAKEEVLGPDAPSIIASMANEFCSWNEAERNGIYDSMNVKGCSSNLSGAISFTVNVTSPLKTLTKRWYDQSSPGAMKETPKYLGPIM